MTGPGAVPAALAGVADAFRDTVLDGPLLLAIPVAAIAGIVSFLSPCVLPLVPGYLSYMTGLSGADLEGEAADRHPWRRVLAGGTLFVLGFSLVFVSYGALFGSVGERLRSRGVTVALGVLTVLLGLFFMGVLSRVPLLNRDFRLRRLPAAGLAGAPLLGVFFGIGWAPCIGPTLGAVLTLAYDSASAGRGALLAFVYCLGLGLPFLVAGLAYRRAMAAFRVVRRHTRAVTAVGGALLVVLGVLQVTGVWDRLVVDLQGWISGFETAV